MVNGISTKVHLENTVCLIVHCNGLNENILHSSTWSPLAGIVREKVRKYGHVGENMSHEGGFERLKISDISSCSLYLVLMVKMWALFPVPAAMPAAWFPAVANLFWKLKPKSTSFYKLPWSCMVFYHGSRKLTNTNMLLNLVHPGSTFSPFYQMYGEGCWIESM